MDEAKARGSDTVIVGSTLRARYGQVVVLACSLLVASGALASGSSAELSTDSEEYWYLDGAGLSHVTITFSNPTPTTVTLPNPAPFVIEDESTIVYTPGSISVWVAVPPGGTYNVTWDFTTNCWLQADPNCFGLALPGEYHIDWRYFEDDPPTPSGSRVLSAVFQIGATP